MSWETAGMSSLRKTLAFARVAEKKEISQMKIARNHVPNNHRASLGAVKQSEKSK